MANNRLAEGFAYIQSVAVSSPASPTSNQAVRYGTMTGVALLNKGEGGNASTKTTVDFGPGLWNLSVKGVNDGGNSAVSAGDDLYFVDGDAFLSKKLTSGYYFGQARATVGSGSTATISVMHNASPGSGTLASGGAFANLTSTFKTGFINLPIDGALIIGSNDIANTAHVSKNTDPILERSNAATDKGLRLSWASGSVLEVQLPQVAWPADLDQTAAVIVNILAGMKSASVDVPVIAVAAFEGVGGTNLGGNTAALSTTLAKKTVSLTVTGYPGTISLTLKPATHATSANDAYVYGVWLEYTRK